MSDNIYPRSSEYMGVGDDEGDDKQVINGIEEIRECIERLKEREIELTSVFAIPNEVLTQPEELAIVLSSNKTAAIAIAQERVYLENLIEGVAND